MKGGFHGRRPVSLLVQTQFRNIAARSLNGLLLASGGLAVSQSAPMRVLAAEKGGICDGAIGSDPRLLRGGDLPSAFNVAHWLRDRRLRFDLRRVTLAPGCDTFEGNSSISDDGEKLDVIIVGAGLAGLSAAFYLLRRRSGTRILLLDPHPYAGGNAGHDEGAPLSVPASTAGAYCYGGDINFIVELYREVKIEWQQHLIPHPMDCYYFDEHTPGAKSGYRGWNIDTLHNGLKLVPYERRIVDDLLRSRNAINTLDTKDPPDLAPRDLTISQR